MTITVDSPGVQGTRPTARHGARALGHALLSGTTLLVALFLALWSHVAAPGQSVALRSTHGVAAWVALVPLLAALAANGALLGTPRPDRSFDRARSAAFALHALSFASLLFAANDRATEYGVTLSTSYSVEHARGSVLWVLLAIASAAMSSALSSIVLITTLHYGRDNVWSQRSSASWSLYVASFVSAFSAAVALLWTLLVAGERLVGVGVFEPTLGGHVLRFQQLRALWAQPVLVSVLIVALGAIEERVATAVEQSELENVGVRRRWPYLWLALLSPFGFSPVEAWWHDSVIVVMASSFLGLMFYGPLLSMVARWTRALAIAPERWSVRFVCGAGASVAILANSMLGALLAVASVGQGYALTTLPTALAHGLAVTVLAIALIVTVSAKQRLDDAREAKWASVAVVLGALLAWGASVAAGVRAATQLQGTLAAIVSLSSLVATLGALVIVALAAQRWRTAAAEPAGVMYDA